MNAPCPKCGAPSAAEALICVYCGHKLHETSSVAEELRAIDELGRAADHVRASMVGAHYRHRLTALGQLWAQAPVPRSAEARKRAILDALTRGKAAKGDAGSEDNPLQRALFSRAKAIRDLLRLDATVGGAAAGITLVEFEVLNREVVNATSFWTSDEAGPWKGLGCSFAMLAVVLLPFWWVLCGSHQLSEMTRETEIPAPFRGRWVRLEARGDHGFAAPVVPRVLTIGAAQLTCDAASGRIATASPSAIASVSDEAVRLAVPIRFCRPSERSDDAPIEVTLEVDSAASRLTLAGCGGPCDGLWTRD